MGQQPEQQSTTAVHDHHHQAATPSLNHNQSHTDFGDFTHFNDYSYATSNGSNEFGGGLDQSTKSDNSQPASNTNDSLLFENDASFDLDAGSLNDGSNSSNSASGGGFALKKKKSNNSKNYIGKQNLFQEFQSEDVTKIRDSENKYIIGTF